MERQVRVGVFVQIYSGQDWRQRAATPTFVGALVTGSIAAVADYELFDLGHGPGDGPAVARLAQYSRWSEPGLALTARLIERADPTFLAGRLESLPAVMVLTVGRSPVDATMVEVLVVGPELDASQAEFSSPVRCAQARMAPVAPDASLRDVLMEAARWIFGWHPGTPPIPRPLSEVQIREDAEGHVVALADIPHHARAHFLLQFGGAAGPATVPARPWLQFIGEERGKTPAVARSGGDLH